MVAKRRQIICDNQKAVLCYAASCRRALIAVAADICGWVLFDLDVM